MKEMFPLESVELLGTGRLLCRYYLILLTWVFGIIGNENIKETKSKKFIVSRDIYVIIFIK